MGAMHPRRFHLAMLFAVIAIVPTIRAAAAQPDPRPNIIIILVGDLGWSDIGPYGSEIPTPNLDRLAARGVRFTQIYSTPRCSPMRASLLTGVYPHQAGMGHLDTVIRRGARRCYAIHTVCRLQSSSMPARPSSRP
jgi:hypothetical protein